MKPAKSAEQFRKVTENIGADFRALQPANKELERLNELLSNTPSAALEKTRNDMLLLAAAFESGRLTTEKYFEAVNVSLGTVDSTPAVKELTAIGIAIQGIASDAASAFTDLLFEGKNSFAELAQFALKELAKIVLFQSVFGPLASGISGGLAGTGFLAGVNSFGKRASGGPVSGGLGYLIGERGPEVFIPSSSGQIIPNRAIASGSTSTNNVVVNVSTQGTPAVDGSNQKANELGRAIAGAVRQVLIQEQRPGGVLS